MKHKTIEIDYNFPSKVYEKSKVRSIDLNTLKYICVHLDKNEYYLHAHVMQQNIRK